MLINWIADEIFYVEAQFKTGSKTTLASLVWPECALVGLTSLTC